jgi:hypothetical protein
MVVKVGVLLCPAAAAETKLNDVTAMSPATSGTRGRKIREIANINIDLTTSTARVGDAKTGLRQILRLSLVRFAETPVNVTGLASQPLSLGNTYGEYRE